MRVTAASARAAISAHGLPAAPLALAMGVAAALPSALAGEASLVSAAATLALVAVIAEACLIAAASLLPLDGAGTRARATTGSPKPARWAFPAATVALLACWGAVFLALYPGCVTDDGLDILHMVLGLPTRTDAFRYDGLNNHHPALYALAIKAVLGLGSALGLGLTARLALVTLAHMAALAVCCAYAAAWLLRRYRSRAAFAGALAFFALDPVLAKVSLAIWKDIPFAGCLLVFSLKLLDVLDAPATGPRGGRATKAPSPRDAAVLVALGLACALLRNNGLLAVGGALAVAALASRAHRRCLASALAATALAYALVTGPVFALAGIAPGHFAESVGIPIQQIARTYRDGGDIAPDDAEVFERMLPAQGWAAGYNPGSANGVKFSHDFDDAYLDAHQGAFLAAWLRTGLSNPVVYLRAWCDQTAAFWHWDPASRIWTASSRDVELGGEAVRKADLLPVPVAPEQVEATVSWTTEHLAPLFNQALLCWAVAAGTWALARRRDRAAACALLPQLFLWATLIIAAPSSDFRYALPMFVMLPVIACLVALKRPARGSGDGAAAQPAGAHFAPGTPNPGDDGEGGR